MTLRPILAFYIPVAEMLVRFLGNECEIVIHDMTMPEHSIVYIANSYISGRQLGDGIGDMIPKMLLTDSVSENYVSNYFFTAPNGKLLRASSLLIKDKNGRLEGVFCVNLDTTRYARQMEYLSQFLPEQHQLSMISSQKNEDQDQNIITMVGGLIDNILGDKPTDDMTREERVNKVRFMDERGIFQVKGSIDRVAERLGVNKVTIYSYLDEIHGKQK